MMQSWRTEVSAIKNDDEPQILRREGRLLRLQIRATGRSEVI